MCQAKEYGGIRCNSYIEENKDKNVREFNQLIVDEYEKRGMHDVLEEVEIKVSEQSEDRISKDPGYEASLVEITKNSKHIKMAKAAFDVCNDPAHTGAPTSMINAILRHDTQYTRLKAQQDAFKSKVVDGYFTGTFDESNQFKLVTAEMGIIRDKKTKEAYAIMDKGLAGSPFMKGLENNLESSYERNNTLHEKLYEKFSRQEFNKSIAQTGSYQSTAMKLQEAKHPGVAKFAKRQEELNFQNSIGRNRERELNKQAYNAECDGDMVKYNLIAQEREMNIMNRLRTQYANVKASPKGTKDMLKMLKGDFAISKKRHKSFVKENAKHVQKSVD